LFRLWLKELGEVADKVDAEDVGRGDPNRIAHDGRHIGQGRYTQILHESNI